MLGKPILDIRMENKQVLEINPYYIRKNTKSGKYRLLGMELYDCCNHDSKHADKAKGEETTNSNIKADESISTNTFSHPWTMMVELFVMSNLMEVYFYSLDIY